MCQELRAKAAEFPSSRLFKCMKLSNKTLQILKNFSSINQSIIIQQGHQLVTVADNKIIIGYSEIDEEFPKDFAIYDLNKFINSINLLKEPTLEFFEEHLNISNGDSSIEYYYADAEVLTQPPKSEYILPSVDISVLLTTEHMSAISKSSNNLDLPDLSLIADNNALKLLVHNKSIKTGNKFQIDLGFVDYVGTANLKIENMKFLSGSYYLEISSKGICKFTNEDMDLKYFVALEQDSKLS